MRLSKRLRTGSSRPVSSTVIDDEYRVARRRMVQDQLLARAIDDRRVLDAMTELPRHLFVDEALASQAYQDSPLNIGFGQTISQPFMVAFLAEALGLKGTERILEIGTGCGYQTAVLSRLAAKIYSIERIRPLLFKARTTLKKIGIKNVVLRLGDGSMGWTDQCPFDAIVAAAVSPEPPQPLLDQLAENGRLVMPVARSGTQYLVRVHREKHRFIEEILGECRFVPMIGAFGFREIR